jgi:hypothetical protein
MSTEHDELRKVGVTTAQRVRAVRRMSPAARRRLIERLSRAADAPTTDAAPPRDDLPAGPPRHDFIRALDAAVGILDVRENPVRWQRRVRAEWDDRPTPSHRRRATGTEDRTRMERWRGR